MLTGFQSKWGVGQWTAFLKERDMPVLPESRDFLLNLTPEQRAEISPAELTAVVYRDAFLAIRLLRRAEATRSHTHLSHETTTPLASVMHNGLDGLVATVRDSPVCDASETGLMACNERAVMAARIAAAWASFRSDISPDEVSFAALLSEIGELMLWHFAPELPTRAADALRTGAALRNLQAQQMTIGFSFKQLSLELIDAWSLPSLIAMLIKGSDNPRANIARLATDTARHIQSNPENPAIPSDLVFIREIVPAASFPALIRPLAISPEYAEEVLCIVEKEPEA